MLSELTLSDKIALLTGGDFWHTKALPQHGVPGLRMSDGPNGVRGIKFFNGKGASCFPCGTGLAASFDVDLMRRVGEALGDEARAKGVHIILGASLLLLVHNQRRLQCYCRAHDQHGALAPGWALVRELL